MADHIGEHIPTTALPKLQKPLSQIDAPTFRMVFLQLATKLGIIPNRIAQTEAFLRPLCQWHLPPIQPPAELIVLFRLGQRAEPLPQFPLVLTEPGARQTTQNERPG